MRTDISHLPARNQRELERIVQAIFEEFEDEHKLAQGERKRARILKILLYGSFARGDWVWSPETNGYASDYDILIIVNQDELLDEIHWVNLRDRLSREHDILGRVRHETSVIVHTLQQVNSNLAEGRHFFVNMQRDAIALYQLEDSELATPRSLGPETALALAEEYFEDWYPTAGEFYEAFEFGFERKRYKFAAFQLHQAAERLYHAVLLTCTLYTPHTHNLEYLRKITKQVDRRLVYVWPEGEPKARARFNRLKEAYVKARYSKHFRISAEDLTWLAGRVQELSQVVLAVCQERLADLRHKAAGAPTAERDGSSPHAS
jgi:uncharacterized protein